MPILETIGLEKRFGGIVATNNVSIKVDKGARHALIGPNGAGKTTLINLLTGVLRPTAGAIILEGREITALAPYRRVRRGMARTFQINQLFLNLSPLETIGLAVSERLGLGNDWWRLVGSKSEVTEEIAETAPKESSYWCSNKAMKLPKTECYCYATNWAEAKGRRKDQVYEKPKYFQRKAKRACLLP